MIFWTIKGSKNLLEVTERFFLSLGLKVIDGWMLD